jgi:hypothetical protein
MERVHHFGAAFTRLGAGLGFESPNALPNRPVAREQFVPSIIRAPFFVKEGNIIYLSDKYCACGEKY